MQDPLETPQRESVAARHDALQWLDRTDLYAVGWLPADLPIVQALERLMVGSTPNP